MVAFAGILLPGGRLGNAQSLRKQSSATSTCSLFEAAEARGRLRHDHCAHVARVRRSRHVHRLHPRAPSSQSSAPACTEATAFAPACTESLFRGLLFAACARRLRLWALGCRGRCSSSKNAAGAGALLLFVPACAEGCRPRSATETGAQAPGFSTNAALTGSTLEVASRLGLA